MTRMSGWCSVDPGQCRHVYNLPCSQLCEGDLCLPPHHPEHSLHSHSSPHHPEHYHSSPQHSQHFSSQLQSANITPECHHSADYSSSSTYLQDSAPVRSSPATHTPDYIADDLRRWVRDAFLSMIS